MLPARRYRGSHFREGWCRMAQWAWVFGFLAVLLVFAWYMDRRTKRRCLGLLAHEPGGRADLAVSSAERVVPGINVRANWASHEGRSSGGGGGP
jgi:hypothetical protein